MNPSETITLWRPVPGASADGHLVGTFADLPTVVQQRARSELNKNDAFVLFVVGKWAGLVATGRGVMFGKHPAGIKVEILHPAKGGGSVLIRVPGQRIAFWPCDQATIPRITDAARFIGNVLKCPTTVIDLGVDC